MYRLNTERFLTTSEAFLMGPDDHTPRRQPRASMLLVEEFVAAVAAGPETLLSTPESMREAQATLSQLVSRMIDDKPELIIDILMVMRYGTKERLVEFLANEYAAWVIASYERGAFP